MKFFLRTSLLIIIVVLIAHIISLYNSYKNVSVSYLDYQSNFSTDIGGLSIPYSASEIDLSSIVVDDDIIKKLELFRNLKKVIIKNQNLSTEFQINMEKKFPNIEFEWDVTLLGNLVDSKIETLDLTKCKVQDINSFKTSLSLLHNLKKLDMSDCNLSNEDLAKLREEFPNTKIVWKIYLGKWSLKTDVISFSVLVTRFDYRRMTSADIEVLKYCTDLQALDVGHQSITDISVIGEYLPNLRILILADNKISDISPISKLKHLHYLELFMNNIKDISPLVSCTELVDLNLAHIPSLYDFSPLIDNDFHLLERLCMQNSGGTTKYYNSIRAKYPNVKIVYKGYGSTHSGWRTHPRYFAMIDMFNKRNYMNELFSKYDNM